jgi:hypothetical protein
MKIEWPIQWPVVIFVALVFGGAYVANTNEPYGLGIVSLGFVYFTTLLVSYFREDKIG